MAIRDRRSFFLLFAVLALLGAGLACSLVPRAPTPPASPIPVSTEAAGELEEAFAGAAATAAAGSAEVTVTMTEEQLTSYANIKLEEQSETPPITDLQIFLRDGQVLVYGNATTNRITAPAQLVVELTPDDQGRLAVDIVSGNIGGLPVPGALLDSLTDMINNTLTDALTVEGQRMRVSSISIADGEMVVTGRLGE